MPGSADLLDARILIVDDQESNVRLLEHVLRRAGYVAVASTTDPVGVRELHDQNQYDLIILDIQMPRMSGLEVLKGLRSAVGGDGVAALVLTADPAQMVRALELGATGFLGKPFVLAEVLLRVRLMLEVTPRFVAVISTTAYGVTAADAGATAGTLRQSTGRITRNVEPLPSVDSTATCP